MSETRLEKARMHLIYGLNGQCPHRNQPDPAKKRAAHEAVTAINPPHPGRTEAEALLQETAHAAIDAIGVPAQPDPDAVKRAHHLLDVVGNWEVDRYHSKFINLDAAVVEAHAAIDAIPDYYSGPVPPNDPPTSAEVEEAKRRVMWNLRHALLAGAEGVFYLIKASEGELLEALEPLTALARPAGKGPSEEEFGETIQDAYDRRDPSRPWRIGLARALLATYNITEKA